MNYQSIPLIGSALLLSTLSANGQKKNTQPNILFILCDDMGYGDLGCYGQPFIRTPHIDAMAGEGMRFTQAYAGSPVSAPSRASFMTGQHSGHCEVRGNKEYWKNAPIVEYGQNKEYSIVGQHPYDPDHVILPEIMKDNGYTTGMFGKWAGGYEGSCSTPDKRGIDEYYGYICQFQAHLYYPNFLNRYSKALGDTGVVRVVMDENIQYPMYGPDYLKRPQYSADMIHQKEKLKEKGLDENTLVIFSSDNGPHEEGGADPTFFGRDGKLRGLKRQCHEGGIRIPFIARWPGHIPAGEVNDHICAFYDLMPTFCEVIGIKDYEKKYRNKEKEVDYFDGISFAPTLLGNKKQKKHDFLYWEFDETDQIAVRMDDWKMVVKKGTPFLYNLKTDIHEDHDIALQHPDIVEKMKAIIFEQHTPNPHFSVTLPKR